MLELYHHGTSVCAAKVRLVLDEKGLEWTGHYVDLMKGEQFAPAYVAINPGAVVPTLVVDGTPIRESTVICEYLEDIAGDPPLRPADPLDGARLRLWTKLVDEKLHPMTGALTYICTHRYTVIDNHSPEELEAFINETRDPDKRERKRQWITMGLDAPDARKAIATYDQALDAMEAALDGGDWLAGPAYSLADVALTPYVNRLAMLGMAEMWAARPRVGGWFERIRARPNFEPAVMSWIPDPAVRAMAENGARSWPAIKALRAA